MSNKISRRRFVQYGLMTGAGLMLGMSAKPRFNVIIRNGMVYDGSGQAPFKKDIGIQDDRISVLDNLAEASADVVIDAEGMAVSPGFIDIHSHTDVELLINPKGESKIRQGVTTDVSGNCGSSPFPMIKEDALRRMKELNEHYGIKAQWDDAAGFLHALEENKIALNYATFTGHGDLRSVGVGKNDVKPTPDQMKSMKKLLDESMEAGSLGLSTGLEYAPGSYADTEELIELCRVVATRHGIYATHMRSEDIRLEEAVEEAIRICREADVSTEISHLKTCYPEHWHKADKVLTMISDAVQSGLPVLADRYPYIAYGTGLSAFIPLWARQGERNEIVNRLKNDSTYAEIKKHLLYKEKQIGGWKNLVISSCHLDKNKIWEGQSIQDGAEFYKISGDEFIRNMLIEEEIRTDIVGFAMSEDNLQKILAHPLVMVGSDGTVAAPYGSLSRGKPHPRYYGTFPRVLGRYVREIPIMKLETAITKMTAMPADKLGLKQRGRILPGYYADLVIFNPGTVIDQATFVNPHQYPIGIRDVLVNGTPAILNGDHTGSMTGRILRSSS